MTTLRQIEELSLNALPCEETIYYDGWLLRFAGGSGGYPRRANSIQLLYPSLLPLEEKIAYCEAQYDARGFKTVFKMTLAAPDGLEEMLMARGGYTIDAETCVQTLDLASIDPQPDAAIEAQIETQMSEAWFSEFSRLNEDNPARVATTRLILEKLSVTSAFVRLVREGETLALGRGALDQGWIAPYEIVTDPRFRRQGFGTELMLHLLKWGKERGARNAYLQVMAENTSALKLYGKLGFHEQYRYWYVQKLPRQPNERQ